MDDHRRQQLVEQYEDIALTLLMDDYAEEDGAKLLQAFEEAQKNGEITEIPPELDEKCISLITGTYKKWERRNLLTRVSKTIAKAAVVVLAVLGLSTVTVLSVDALRTPVLNFFLLRTEKYTTLSTNEKDSIEQTQQEIVERMLNAPIPDEYQLVSQELVGDGAVVLRYENADGYFILFECFPSSRKVNIDTENTEIIELELNGYEAILIIKDSFRVIWIDPTLKVTFDLYANGLDPDGFWELAYRLAE